MIKEYWDIIKQISLYKTLRFNIHYFGLKTVFRHGPYCFIAKNVKLSCLKGKVIVENPIGSRVRLGFEVGMPIFDRRYDRFQWHNTGTIVFHEQGQILLGSRIDNSGYLEFGEDVYCNALTTILCRKEIIIGNNCCISWRSLIMDTDHHCITDELGNVLNKNQPIRIGDQVWVNCNATILKGTEISTQTIVAAGAILSGKKFKEENIIIGGTGHILKRNITWNSGRVS